MPEEPAKKGTGLIEYLTGLSSANDRGPLATLRRGLGYPPGECIDMYRYIAHCVPDWDRNTDREKIYYLVAALYAYYPISAPEGNKENFGNHMALAASRLPDPISTERRFTVLLNANSSDLAGAMRQAVSFIRSKDIPKPIPINWKILFNDLMHWDLPDKRIQRRWANAFWAYQKPLEENQTVSSINDQQEK
jgi:CRISPR system Cascade subunit CasB